MRATLPIPAVDAINPAFQHAKEQLFHPIRFAQWARLALVGLLAGELGSSGSHFHFNAPSAHHLRETGQFPGMAWTAQLAHHPGTLAGLVVLLAVAGIGIVVLLTYLNCMMRFILFDSVVAKECHIRQGWSRWKGPGFRYFLWQLLLTLLALGAFSALVGIPVAGARIFGWFTHPREHLVPLILGGVALFLLLIALGAALTVIHVMTKDFVVPQMALENIDAWEGWRRLWKWINTERGSYAAYIVVKIALSIVAGVAFGIITIIVVLTLLAPIGGLGVVGVLAGKAAGLTWNWFTIALAVLVGCVVLAIVMFAVSVVSVPAIVFFPAYSVHFFASRYPPLAALLWPEGSRAAGSAPMN
jgi:hypothetical protein